MPKRAQFAPGFPELRGNVSGKQNLVYPTKDNKAYEGPVGSKNYARNYRPSVIVSQRMRDGGFHYAIRLRSANHLTEKSKTAMALLGGAGAIYAAIQKDTVLNLRTHSSYTLKVTQGYTGTYRKYVMDIIREALAIKAATFSFQTATSSVTINNPWVVGGTGASLVISQGILIKFASVLAAPPVIPVVLGAFGKTNLQNGGGSLSDSKAWSEMTLQNKFVDNLPTDVTANEYYRLQADLMDPSHRMMLQHHVGESVSEYWVITLNGSDVAASDDVVEGAEYGLTAGE